MCCFGFPSEISHFPSCEKHLGRISTLSSGRKMPKQLDFAVLSVYFNIFVMTSFLVLYRVSVSHLKPTQTTEEVRMWTVKQISCFIYCVN